MLVKKKEYTRLQDIILSTNRQEFILADTIFIKIDKLFKIKKGELRGNKQQNGLGLIIEDMRKVFVIVFRHLSPSTPDETICAFIYRNGSFGNSCLKYNLNKNRAERGIKTTNILECILTVIKDITPIDEFIFPKWNTKRLAKPQIYIAMISYGIDPATTNKLLEYLFR